MELRDEEAEGARTEPEREPDRELELDPAKEEGRETGAAGREP